MKQEDREKTTFCASRGLFHYRVMSFGLVNAGARYGHMMGMVLNRLDHFGNYQVNDVVVQIMAWTQRLATIHALFRAGDSSRRIVTLGKSLSIMWVVN